LEFCVSAGSTTSPSSRDADVRDRIFVAALRHFSQKGYAATSLREVSQDAQTTKPMIYYYFGSKEGLYGSIVRQILEETGQYIESRLTGNSEPAEELLAYCAAYLDSFLENEEIIALVLREVFGLGGAPLAAFSATLGDRVRMPLDLILRNGMDSGRFSEAHVVACATAIMGILNMFILSHVFGGAAIDRETPLTQVGYYLRGLDPNRG
jgi:AcrR family transcriptional regulator